MRLEQTKKRRCRQDVSCQLLGDGYDVVAALLLVIIVTCWGFGTRIESLVSNFDEQRNCVCFDPGDAHIRSSGAQRQHQLDVINGTFGFDIKYLPRSVFKWHHQEERAVSLTNSGDQGRTRRCHSWRLAAVSEGKVPDHDVQGTRKSGMPDPSRPTDAGKDEYTTSRTVCISFEDGRNLISTRAPHT